MSVFCNLNEVMYQLMAKQKGGIYLKVFRKNLQEKLKETVKAVLPVIAIVLLLCFTIAPVSPGILMAFLIGAVLLTAGMVFFSLGVDMAMTHMGGTGGNLYDTIEEALGSYSHEFYSWIHYYHIGA